MDIGAINVGIGLVGGLGYKGEHNTKHKQGWKKANGEG